MTIKIVSNQNEPAEDHTPVDVAMWYDRHVRSWCLYPVDALGTQLAQARYAYRKDTALLLKKDIESDIESGNREGWYYI